MPKAPFEYSCLAKCLSNSCAITLNSCLVRVDPERAAAATVRGGAAGRDAGAPGSPAGAGLPDPRVLAPPAALQVCHAVPPRASAGRLRAPQRHAGEAGFSLFRVDNGQRGRVDVKCGQSCGNKVME